MAHLGDYTEDYATLNTKFTTRQSTGAPFTLAGTPVVSVYKANDITQSTVGITLTPDFDGLTGLNNVLIDLSADAFYAVGNDYQVVITTGTVNGVSVVGEVVAEFSIENRFMRGTDSAALASALATAQSDLDILTGTDGATLATAQANYAPAKAADIVTAGAITTSSGAVVNVTTVATTTTNSDMRGTDNALLAANVPTNFADLAITATTGKVTVGTNDDKTGYDLNADQSGVTIGTLTGQTPQTGDSYLLLTGAQAEPTGVPAANETIAAKIAYLFATMRNKITVTATKKQYFDDADAAMWEKDLSDNGTTYTETEANAP